MSQDPRLRPREHGAYAMLAFPAVSGLVIGGPSAAGVAFIALAVSGFLAHESVLVVLGGRGERIRSRQEGEARGRLVRLGIGSVAAALVFALTCRPEACVPALIAGALAAGVGLLLLAGRTKTLPGELLVAASFASVHAVVTAAGGRAPGATYLPAAAWTASFAVATLSVHALKARFKGRGLQEWTVSAAPALAGTLLLLAAAALATRHPLGGLAASLVPKTAVVSVLAAVAVHPRHLKRVGWSFVAADGLTLFLLAWLVG